MQTQRTKLLLLLNKLYFRPLVFTGYISLYHLLYIEITNTPVTGQPRRLKKRLSKTEGWWLPKRGACQMSGESAGESVSPLATSIYCSFCSAHSNASYSSISTSSACACAGYAGHVARWKYHRCHQCATRTSCKSLICWWDCVTAARQQTPPTKGGGGQTETGNSLTKVKPSHTHTHTYTRPHRGVLCVGLSVNDKST